MIKPTAWQNARRALTVVEVLVILSIIALAVAIVLPSFKRGGCGSTRIHCMANIRNVSQAALTYTASDTGGNAIPVAAGELRPGVGSHLPAYAYGGKSGRGSGGADSPWGLRAGLGAAHRPLNAILYPNGVGVHSDAPTEADCQFDAALDLDVFRCPTDKAFAGTHHRAWRRDRLSSYDHYGTSYAANILYALTDDSPDRLVSISPYRKPVSRIPAPSATVLFADNGARFEFMRCAAECPPTCALGGILPDPTGSTAEGHKGGYNLAFADGHAQWMTISGHSPQKASPSEPVDPSADLQVRGLDWRLDVLPATPAATPFTPLGNRRVQFGDPPVPDFELVTSASP